MIFPLVSAHAAYLVSKLEGAALIGAQHVEEGVTFFRVRIIILWDFKTLSLSLMK